MWGASPPSFLKAFAGPRGRPDLKNAPQKSGQTAFSYPVLRIQPEIFDFEPGLGLKLGQTKPKISGTVPTNRHTTIPNDPGECPKARTIGSNISIPAELKTKSKIKNHKIRAGIGPKPTIALGKWQSGPSPGTPRAKETKYK